MAYSRARRAKQHPMYIVYPSLVSSWAPGFSGFVFKRIPCYRTQMIRSFFAKRARRNHAWILANLTIPWCSRRTRKALASRFLRGLVK